MTTVLHLNHFVMLQVYQYPFLGKQHLQNHYGSTIKYKLNLILNIFLLNCEKE